MMQFTIPYGRDLTIKYYHGGGVASPRMKLSRYSLELILLPEHEYNNMRDVWVASTIANTLRDKNGVFECDMEPIDDVFTVTRSFGGILRFKLCNNKILVQL